MPQFENIDSYDKPRVLAEMLFDNELTLTGIQRALFSPERLTLSEREGAISRLKEASGNTKIGNALTDIATNPFVWLAVLLSPGHNKRLVDAVREGKPIFSPKVSVDAAHREKSLLLGQMNLLTPSEELEGTPIATLLRDWQSTASKVALEDQKDWGVALAKWMDQNGFKDLEDLDPRRLGETDPRRKVLQDFLLAFQMRASGLDQTVDRMVPVGKRSFWMKERGRGWQTLTSDEYFSKEKELRAWKDANAKNPNVQETKVPFELTDFIRAAGPMSAIDNMRIPIKDYAMVTPEAVDAVLAQTGGHEVVDAWRRATERHQKRLFLTEEGTLDPVKIHKLIEQAGGKDLVAARLVKDPTHGMLDTVEGIELLSELSSGKMEEAVQLGLLSKDEYKQILKGAYEHILSRNEYLPLNVTETLKPGGMERVAKNADVPQIWDDIAARVIPRTRAQIRWSLEDLEELRNTFGHQGLDMRGWGEAAQASSKAVEDSLRTGKEFTVHRMRPFESTGRYLNDATQLYALRVAPLSQEAVAEFARMTGTTPDAALYKWRRQYKQSLLENTMQGAGQDPRYVAVIPAATYATPLDQIPPSSLPGVANNAEEAFNTAHLLQASHDLIPDADLKQKLAEVIIPTVMQRGDIRHKITTLSWLGARKHLRWLAEGPVGGFLEKHGHEDFVGSLRSILKNDLPIFPGGGLAHGIAKYLYATHLGINLSSVVLNSFQPLILGGTALGPDNVLKGYGPALKEMLDYAKARTSKYGIGPISNEQRLELMNDSFKFMGKATGGRNVMGIGPDPFSSVDAALAGRAHRTRGLLDNFFHYSMMLFEKSEWLNRNVMAHAFENVAKKAGRGLDNYTIHQMERVVQQTQFPSDKLNQPLIFNNNRLLNNPLARMFMTYNMRAFTSAFHTLPRMLEQDYLPGLASSMLRGMGISAVAYEVAKNMAGADISPALYGASTTALWGGDRIFDKSQNPVVLPPVVDIPLNLIRSFAQDDMELLGRTIPRMVPAGVALSRALGVLPKIPTSALGMQKTYVDWNAKTPDGMVPVFKSDGSLIDYRSGSEMIFRSIGADLGKWQQPGELDNYLVKIRDETVGYRQQYLQALKANNVTRAMAIAAEYQKRNKLPLTITSQQVKQSVALSEVPRAERALNRMAQDQREVYTRALLRMKGESALGLPPGTLLSTASAAKRDRNRTVQFDAETQRLIDQMTQQAAPGPMPPFAGFSP